MVNFGALTQVDLRDAWMSEPGDFTPWLAKEQNLLLLADTLAMELELQGQEKEVGPFRADILCKNTADGSFVLVENQLEKTDHTHLGQLMTYAAGLDAVTIVWIAERFTDEHRAAMDWLNKITNEKVSFFGLEIELWRIGDSAIAPKFNVVSKPNDWTKEGPISTVDLSETKVLQLEYWTALRERLIDTKSIVKPQRAQPQTWTNFAIGKTGIKLCAVCNSVGHKVGVRLVMDGPYSEQQYRQLFKQRAEIDNEIGEPMIWEELPGRKEKRIGWILAVRDFTDKADWPAQHDWMRTRLEKLHKTFAGRVKNLDIGGFEVGEEPEPLG